MNARRISTTEVAKLIRKRLKAAFPATTFSVRSSTYSMGSSIRVSWIDGPTQGMVEKITNQYRGSTFDGMLDLKGYQDHWLLPDGSTVVALDPGTEASHGSNPRVENAAPHPKAERVRFGSDSVSCSRDTSPALMTRALEKVKATKHLGDVDVSHITVLPRTFDGRTYGVLSGDVRIPTWDRYLSDMVREDLARRCAAR